MLLLKVLMKFHIVVVACLAVPLCSCAQTETARPAAKVERATTVLTGEAARGDWTTDAPGVRRKLTVNDLAPPYETASANNGPRVVRRPEGAWPKAPAGFTVTQFATGLRTPRAMVT